MEAKVQTYAGTPLAGCADGMMVLQGGKRSSRQRAGPLCHAHRKNHGLLNTRHQVVGRAARRRAAVGPSSRHPSVSGAIIDPGWAATWRSPVRTRS